MNVNGGAVALGHAIGSSGASILTTLIYAMRRGADAASLRSVSAAGTAWRWQSNETDSHGNQHSRRRRRGHDGQRHRPGVCAGGFTCSSSTRPSRCSIGRAPHRGEPGEVRRERQDVRRGSDAALGRLSTSPPRRFADAPTTSSRRLSRTSTRSALFTSLDAIAKADAILASNTSSISITGSGRRPGGPIESSACTS